MAQPGDYVIVHAWSNNSETAVAYNPRNDMTDWIPVETMRKEDSHPVIGSEICVSFSSNEGREIRDLD